MGGSITIQVAPSGNVFEITDPATVDGIDAAGTYVFINDNGSWKAYPATGSAGNYTVASDAAALTITGDPSSVLTTPLGNVNPSDLPGGGGSQTGNVFEITDPATVDGIDAAGTYVFINDNGSWKAYLATGSAGNYTVASDAAALTITGDPSSVLTTPVSYTHLTLPTKA